MLYLKFYERGAVVTTHDKPRLSRVVLFLGWFKVLVYCPVFLLLVTF